MYKKVQYLLAALLFVLAGVLSHQSRPEAPVHALAGTSVCVSIFGGHAPAWVSDVHDAESGRYSCRALLAPELTNSAFDQNYDHKAPARCISLLGYNATACPATAGCAVRRADAPRPGGVEYYIYTLGRIRI